MNSTFTIGPSVGGGKAALGSAGNGNGTYYFGSADVVSCPLDGPATTLLVQTRLNGYSGQIHVPGPIDPRIKAILIRLHREPRVEKNLYRGVILNPGRTILHVRLSNRLATPIEIVGIRELVPKRAEVDEHIPISR
jgi:hypothetical protein